VVSLNAYQVCFAYFANTQIWPGPITYNIPAAKDPFYPALLKGIKDCFESR
jgi:hypothetical protein